MAVNPTLLPVNLMEGNLEFLLPAVMHLQGKNVPSTPAIPEELRSKRSTRSFSRIIR